MSPNELTSDGCLSSLIFFRSKDIGRLVIGGTLVLSGIPTAGLFGGTSSCEPVHRLETRVAYDRDSTTNWLGETCPFRSDLLDQDLTEDTSNAIAELRRISGLTWEQLGELFGVTRRSVHFWASGQKLNAENANHLFRVLGVIRDSDTGSPETNRAKLLESVGGSVPIDLLAASKFDEARAALGVGRRTPSMVDRRLATESMKEREPLRPEILLAGGQDLGTKELGRIRKVNHVRKHRRG